ncbi:uncharacterized protein [Asterias amurensis]|uniref:uncharacterized protein isoform X1 n=1 Tax=Asterias amurensis TaxID=7602 RepID=UPI003AB57C2E
MRAARVVILLLACGVGCFAVVSGNRRPPSVLGEGQLDDEKLLCLNLMNCTNWCRDCGHRQLTELQQDLDDCNFFHDSTDYRYATNCPPGVDKGLTKVCMCKESNGACRSCNPSNTTSELLCLSQERGEPEIQISLPNSRQLQPLSRTCPSCLCSTNAPTTRPTTPRMLVPTQNHGNDNVKPRPTQKSMTTVAGRGQPNEVIIIAVATGGGVLVIVLFIGCLVCYCRRRSNNAPKTVVNDMEEYADIDDIRTMRSQSSMMSRQNLISNEGLNHLPCGHRHFNNEMYGMNAIGNGHSISTQQQAPELPGNHPPPSVPPPMPSQYQGLNRGPLRSQSAMGNGACPHCHQKSVADRSATAPHMDRPTGLDISGSVEGARNPYMALIKTNTCPTPGTPPAPTVCDCHSKPLSECSSVSGSLHSDPQRNSTHAGDLLNETIQEADPECQGGNEDAPEEDPYYFKMQTAAKEPEPEEVSPPQSPRYFKLEDAETILLDGENTPMLYAPDSNGNNVRTKTLPTNSVDSSIEPSSRTESLPLASLADTQPRSPTAGDSPVQSPVSPDLAMQQNGMSRSVEGLPNGDYMHLVKGSSKVTSV